MQNLDGKESSRIGKGAIRSISKHFNFDPGFVSIMLCGSSVPNHTTVYTYPVFKTDTLVYHDINETAVQTCF